MIAVPDVDEWTTTMLGKLANLAAKTGQSQPWPVSWKTAGPGVQRRTEVHL